MKKSIWLIFGIKKWPEISGFAFVKKSSKSLKKKILNKNLICADKIFRTVCGNFLLKNKWISSNFNFGDFTVLKLVLHNKGIDKTRTKKDQENSAYSFGGN